MPFINDKFYLNAYGNYPHFYLNDPDKKFLNCSEATYLGVNFGFMKLVNDHDRRKAAFIKNNYLRNIVGNINVSDQLVLYRNSILKGKRLSLDTRASANSHATLQTMSWISATEYVLPAGKIPAIIRSLECVQKEGIGLLFIVEKLSKPEKTVSGYWVVFDFASRKTLLMDYVNFGKVQLQVSNFNGWDGYWEAGILAAGVYEPLSFQKYLELEKKGKLELVCE